LFPYTTLFRSRLHLLEPGADDHLHVLPAQPAGGTAAIHRRVAAAEYDDATADLGDVAEGDGRKPVDADMDVGCGFLAAGDRQVAPARGAGADKDRVVVLIQQCLETVDALPEAH